MIIIRIIKVNNIKRLVSKKEELVENSLYFSSVYSVKPEDKDFIFTFSNYIYYLLNLRSHQECN